MPQLKKLISNYIQRPGYRGLKPKALAKKLGLTKKKLPAFESALQEAEAAGDLYRTESGRIQPKRPADTYLGTLRKISRGDGFVVLHPPKPEDIPGDVYIDERHLKDAQSGDEVLIRLTKRRRSGGQRCGVVVDVVERATSVFVGTYREEDDAGWVQVDGKDYRDAIWVGDPGAKGAQDGDKVVIEMLRFPSVSQPGEAVVTQVLGPRGEPGVDTQLVIHEFGIPDAFSEKVLQAARDVANDFREEDLDDREDLTGQTIVTIDPVDARDFDDAISLEVIEQGHWLLGVHIADVSHFVVPGTVLDREAERRGNSVYLPTKVIPMLPEVISNGLASLQEGKLRFTMSVFIEFSAEGIPIGARFARTAISVKQRFAYEDVMPIIDAGEEAKSDAVPGDVRDLLHNMYKLAMILRKRRHARGALALDMPEVKLDLDRNGKVVGAHTAPHDESHEIIEEFMLAANIAVATELNDRGLHFIRRVHPDPSTVKLKALGEFASILGYPLKKVQSRKDLQQLLDRVRGRPEEEAINYGLLRSLKQAEYSPVVMGHYALAEEQYCHFTSPIRRYPDLLVHRLILAVLTDNDALLGGGMDEQLRLGRHCSMTERRAEKAERELVKIKLLSYLETRIGDELEAVITGVERFGFFCRGVELPAEGLVHISSLPRQEHFDFDQQARALVARGSGEIFRLGDRVQVEVVHVDVDRRELNYKLITHSKSSRKRKSKGRSTENGAGQSGRSSRKERTPSATRKSRKQKRTSGGGEAPKGSQKTKGSQGKRKKRNR